MQSNYLAAASAQPNSAEHIMVSNLTTCRHLWRMSQLHTVAG
jgi:hypothetical protein